MLWTGKMTAIVSKIIEIQMEVFALDHKIYNTCIKRVFHGEKSDKEHLPLDIARRDLDLMMRHRLYLVKNGNH